MNTRRVFKFGGTSVGSLGRIARAAERVLQARREGLEIVVVVSAMAGETDRLLGLAREMAGSLSAREVDVIASTGEQVTAGLMTIALESLGARARSFLAHQIPIHTDGVFGSAAIEGVDTGALERSLADGCIPVVAGYQGVTPGGDVTTLGRGGSDTTAVALAHALGAVCEIFTDVEGVYSIDPRLAPDARKWPVVDYDVMCALAASGAKVLETRSVETARRGCVPIHVRSSFSTGDGTWVLDGDADADAREAVGVALQPFVGSDEPQRVTVVGASIDRGLGLRAATRALAAAGISFHTCGLVDLGFFCAVDPHQALATARLLHALFVCSAPHPEPARNEASRHAARRAPSSAIASQIRVLSHSDPTRCAERTS